MCLVRDVKQFQHSLFPEIIMMTAAGITCVSNKEFLKLLEYKKLMLAFSPPALKSSISMYCIIFAKFSKRSFVLKFIRNRKKWTHSTGNIPIHINKSYYFIHKLKDEISLYMRMGTVIFIWFCESTQLMKYYFYMIQFRQKKYFIS